jgi:hypothetical protein
MSKKILTLFIITVGALFLFVLYSASQQPASRQRALNAGRPIGDETERYFDESVEILQNLPPGAPMVESPLPLTDYDGDGDTDEYDLNILLADQGKQVGESRCGTPCDLDGDGMITALDAKKLSLLCTRPRCAIE